MASGSYHRGGDEVRRHWDDVFDGLEILDILWADYTAVLGIIEPMCVSEREETSRFWNE